MALRVLVVDDTAVFRRVVSDAFASLPDVEVVGVATNGRAALEKIEELKPDLVSLDIEMPEMDGVQVLQALQSRRSGVGVLVLSALSRKGGELTLKALELGAFDFLTKPTGGNPDQNRILLAEQLGPRIKAFVRMREIQDLMKGAPSAGITSSQSLAPTTLPPPISMFRPAPLAPLLEAGKIPTRPSVSPSLKPELVIIGVSTGGPTALAAVLPQLPATLGVPVLIVQHMPPLFTASLAASLNAKCPMTIKEGQDGELALAGTVYLAPGGSHMKLQLENGEKRIRITDDPPENHCRPAVDVLFRSVAHAFPGKATAVILTGMGNDGTLGCRLLKRHGGTVIAQDEASCVVFGMPKEVISAGVVDIVVPLDRIASEIIRSVRWLP